MTELIKNNPLNLHQEKEDVYITLNCKNCDFVECGIKLKNTMIHGKEGCTKKVNEDVAAQFYHYTEEVMPF